jgi:hypothetical protein
LAHAGAPVLFATVGPAKQSKISHPAKVGADLCFLLSWTSYPLFSEKLSAKIQRFVPERTIRSAADFPQIPSNARQISTTYVGFVAGRLKTGHSEVLYSYQIS